jgi:aryl-alcohol dehydrogenase-like predicted oxidoreductase
VEYRLLGDTGVRISAYSLGAFMFGSTGNADVDECTAIINRSLDSGVNLIDVADIYSDGDAERIVGSAIRGRRDEVVLATKFFGPMGSGVNQRGGSRLWIMRAVEASLRRLGVDHIDLYFAHRPDTDTALAETIDTLDDLVRQGKIRYAGSSTFPAWLQVEAQAISRARGRARFVCEQPPYSILAREIERDVLPVAQRYQQGVVVWSPLAGGWLAGRYRRGEPPPPGSRAARVEEYAKRGGRMRERYELENDANDAKFDVIEALAGIAEEAGITLVELALAFTLSHPAVTSCLIGPRTLDQLDGILAGSTTVLDRSTLDAIDALVAPGSVLNRADEGWDPPWMLPAARRRSALVHDGGTEVTGGSN